MIKKDSYNLSATLIIFVATISGITSGIIKLGWEVMLPPRTFERNLTNPPQALLEFFGFSHDFTHFSYVFSGYDLPLVSFIVHFTFSIVCAFVYIFMINKIRKTYELNSIISALFGIVIFILFHILIMPLLGIIPSPFEQPLDEHMSEFFGHIIWMWVAELTRYALYMDKKKHPH